VKPVKLNVATTNAAAARVDLLVVTMREGESRIAGALDRKAARAVETLVASASFTGKEGKSAWFPAPGKGGARAILVVGLGKPRRDLAEMTRRAAGIALGKAGDLHATRVAFVPPSDDAALAEAAAEGFLLADYKFDRYKTAGKTDGAKGAKGAKGATKKKPEPETTVTLHVGAAARAHLKKEMPRLEALTAGVKLARDLGNEPSNVMTATRLAESARQVAKDRKDSGLRCDVLNLEQIRARGMGAYLGVASGSREEPRFIHLSWKPKKPSGRRVALVGKGLCFDSGGISIKPAQNMEDMKFDMCGAAAVIGVFSCLPELGISDEVHGFVAATENMPGGAAVKPGDILKSMAGRTIEVINTDAEGRLTLVDAITFALESKPDVVIDIATLTGAVAVALGSATGIMSNDDDLRNALWRASDETGERAWPLPLFDDYKTQLKSEYADVKNLGERYGGALTAGLFIQEWVPEGLPWAHLDIAGSAWSDREGAYCPKGATGIAVRTLAHWLRTRG
jgi:leucyl aminopeptidase